MDSDPESNTSGSLLDEQDDFYNESGSDLEVDEDQNGDDEDEDKKELEQNWSQTFTRHKFFSKGGVAIQTVLIGIFSRYALPYKWSWIQSILFGSILSATDPVAVVALLHDNGCNHLLTQLIDSESFLNDGVAFIIFSIFSRLLTVQQQQQVNVKDICIEIVKTTIGM
ncbi:unnamed protein product [Didymodactylos carnosus]|uniref:Cation/H+ exchanger transmembrane domain-containing protein n=1 Tax=Didymodactylos carnosus TaxID=1234261 RepID=A0A8S2SG30_9BILA|nr:unnamed protein product [Didymodactylos carnosus]CAF4199576.1 unnamed protein product [Didymodactylos carnosus]